MLKILRRVFSNSVVSGTLLILLFSVGFTSIFFVLSWLIYRDLYGITFLGYIEFVF